MTSNKLDKRFISAVSNYVYDLIAKDLSGPPEQRHIFLLPSLKFVSLLLFRALLKPGTTMSWSSAEMQFKMYLFIKGVLVKLDLFSISANNISLPKSSMLCSMMMLIRLHVCWPLKMVIRFWALLNILPVFHFSIDPLPTWSTRLWFSKILISMKNHSSEVVAYLVFFSKLLILPKSSVLDGALRIALKSG